jgi:uncharacterized protein (TIGR02996 family)
MLAFSFPLSTVRGNSASMVTWIKPAGQRRRSWARRFIATSNGFLQAILEEPDEDVHRLVYADWLEEHGDQDRAEFIRVQCRLALLSENDPARAALEARQDELLRTHGRVWVEEVPVLPGVTWSGFDRGFPARAAVELSEWDNFENRMSAMLAAAPVREVRFHDVELAEVGVLAGSPSLARLSALSLSAPLDRGRFAGMRESACWPPRRTWPI